MDDTTWPEWLKQRMDEQGLTAQALASQLGRGRRMVVRWRQVGGMRPPATVHENLAAALGVLVSEIRLRLRDERKRRAVHATQPSASVPA